MYKYNHMTVDDKVLSMLTAASDETFKRVYKENPPMYKHELLIRAVHTATIGKIDFLLKDVKNINRVDLMMAAVHRADVKILKLISDYGYDKPSDDPLVEDYLFNPLEYAIIDGKLDVVDYLRSVGYPLTESLMHLACNIRDAVMIKYLVDNDCPRYDLDCYITVTDNLAMKKDHRLTSDNCSESTYKCAKILHDGGFEGQWGCDSNTCSFCISNKTEKMVDIWIMESYEYISIVQWMPREMLEDVVELSTTRK